MSSGDTHIATNLAALAGLGLAAYVLHLPGDVIMAYSAGHLLGTIWITPDLDLCARVRVNALKAWGPLGFLWLPLGAFLTHRKITHTFFRGPLLLLTYAGCIAALIIWLASLVFPGLTTTLQQQTAHLKPSASLLAFLGYLFANWLHLWLDGYTLRDRKRW